MLNSVLQRLGNNFLLPRAREIGLSVLHQTKNPWRTPAVSSIVCWLAESCQQTLPAKPPKVTRIYINLGLFDQQHTLSIFSFSAHIRVIDPMLFVMVTSVARARSALVTSALRSDKFIWPKLLATILPSSPNRS